MHAVAFMTQHAGNVGARPPSIGLPRQLAATGECSGCTLAVFDNAKQECSLHSGNMWPFSSYQHNQLCLSCVSHTAIQCDAQMCTARDLLFANQLHKVLQMVKLHVCFHSIKIAGHFAHRHPSNFCIVAHAQLRGRNGHTLAFLLK